MTGRGGGATDVFAVIAHPARRALLDLLQAAPGQEQSVKRLAAAFEISRPAVSQHLAVLLEAGLVSERKVGRERRYRLRGGRLGEVYDWLVPYERCWRADVAPPAGAAGPSPRAEPGPEATGSPEPPS